VSDRGFWQEGDGRPGEDEAPGPLEGFATGGIAGLLGALDAQDSHAWEDEDFVDDPEALRRAEEAVAHGGAVAEGPQRPILEDWTAVARQSAAVIAGGLDVVVLALESEGIPIGWDPYDPRDAVSYRPPWQSAIVTYSLLVPRSEFERARRLLQGVRPDGVEFAWDAAARGPAAPSAPAPVTEWSQPQQPAGRASDDEAPAMSHGRELSDNVRLERLATGGVPGWAMALGFASAVFVVAALLFVAMRG
jgi:hypothetical protein